MPSSYMVPRFGWEAARRKRAHPLDYRACRLARCPSLWPSPPAEGPRRSSRGVSRRPFVPDVFTGILVISQGFRELSGGVKTELNGNVVHLPDKQGYSNH